MNRVGTANEFEEEAMAREHAADLRERAAIVLEGAKAEELVEMGGEDALRRWAMARALADIYRRRLGYEPPRASRSAHATLARLEAGRLRARVAIAMAQAGGAP